MTPSEICWATALTLAAGCSSGDSAEGDRLRGQLAGRAFLLESAEGFSPVASTTVRLSFEQTELSFYAGCNTHSGSYSPCGEDLCIRALGSTEIGCASELQAQDQWLAGFMTARPRLSLDGDRLTLSGADATLAFLDRELADPDRPLTGRVWLIDTFIDGDAASNIPLPSSPTVSFDEQGRAQIFTTCNTGTGAYTRQGRQLLLSDVLYTEAACASAASAAADARIQRVLSDGTLTAEIEAARLTLTRAEVGLSATTD
ncbi:MAG: META domain-containing protein [Deltaproteobacteria bacterium]